MRVHNMFNVKPHSINIIEFIDKGEFNINLFETRRYKTTLNNIILCDTQEFHTISVLEISCVFRDIHSILWRSIIRTMMEKSHLKWHT